MMAMMATMATTTAGNSYIIDINITETKRVALVYIGCSNNNRKMTNSVNVDICFVIL